MAKVDRKHIVMFAAEAAPFVKVGGLAEVTGALPKVLEKSGARVALVIPGYQQIPRRQFGIGPAIFVPSFEVPMGSETVPVEVEQTTLPGSGVPVYFLGGGDYFAREGVYDDPLTRLGFPDNAQRYAFFVKAGIELLSRLGAPVDVVHCHDAQAALVPGILRTTHQDDPFWKRIGCLYTIHNAAYQGLYPKEILGWAGIDSGCFRPSSPFEFWGKVNLMKIGIELADLVSTVSETYAREIQSDPEYGCGLEGSLRSRAHDLYGILNGIDYDEWNPGTDPQIPAHYSADDFQGKALCKAELLRAMRLPERRERTPLIGIVSRLADQKGFDLIGEAIEQIVSLDLQMAVLGTGQRKYHKLFEDISVRYPDKVAVKLDFDDPLAHLIEAGADMFLMPSRYEPCGLNQLYSLRYGTPPIVRATGGLADTITDFDARADRGTGFVFKEYTAVDMLAAIERALAAFRDAVRWRRLVERGMKQRWSWEDSAHKYLQLYERICRRRGSR
ncbi:MAG: glycogen synthase [Acidobacteriota bacterium]|jgi:starch synthase